MFSTRDKSMGYATPSTLSTRLSIGNVRVPPDSTAMRVI